MRRVDAIHRAIQHVYEATLAPENWPNAVASVAEAGGAHRAILHAAVADGPSLAVSSGFRMDDVARLQQEIENRLPAWVEAIPVGTALRQTSAITDTDFERSELYNEAVRPAGGYYGIVAPLVRGPECRVLLTLARNAGAADFSPEDLRAATVISPHVVTALKVWRRIADSEGRASWTYEAIARLNLGVVFLNAKMHPVLANPRAEALAAARDGLLLDARKLSAIRPSDAAKLGDAISAVSRFADASRSPSESATAAFSARNCTIHRAPPRRPLIARVIPIGLPYSFSLGIATARTIVFIMEPDRPAVIDTSLLTSAFGLTPREAALAVALVQGSDLQETAKELNIGVGTARSYLKRILSKTDTHRQAELVSVLLRGSFHPLVDEKGTYNDVGKKTGSYRVGGFSLATSVS
ncbi:helix-turn-helix transcriptional regulator [Paraburkholderia fynbosensis]|uniref:HTH luxR-type domain-containing protein n=1 Tax=Paraburkholderia fynbosensis TaxID=1200993 RepID=A0A6J5GT82_9BURK|nr:helix-turn-helix transcriptional regulator [Paraburkholderia fynbosensis]CAB3805713.1 hypothetical protein LMG27177_05911 [Paraburkholderia fynbosensis]